MATSGLVLGVIAMGLGIWGAWIVAEVGEDLVGATEDLEQIERSGG